MNARIPFLLEIGTEEIPARFFRTAIPDLKRHTSELFDRNRVEFTDIECFATPRRLTVKAIITSDSQKSIVTEVTGPPVKASFDDNNNPTKAAEGFARSQGVAVKDLRIKKTDRGEYIAAVKEEKGEKISRVLPVVAPEIVRSLHFPKSMRWGNHSFRFARPVNWILCMLGRSVVRFEIDGIKSGQNCWGHRLLANSKIKLEHPGSYEGTLKKYSVIVDHSKRRQIIEKSIIKIADSSKAKYIKDDELLDTVNFLVEYPYAVKCSFPEKYLELPEELLITVMKDHQKYFAMSNKKGKLINSFIVISNTNSKAASVVRTGAEKVIKARFEDARFYFNDDRKTNLMERIDTLKGVTFHDKIGTVHEKVQRIVMIVSDLADSAGIKDKDTIVMTAKLCKADLTSGVVREFPELQGIIGHYYALNDGLSNDLAVSIKEHYKPVQAGDASPSTTAGKITSIADKIDSIYSFFSIGEIPTGSEDPFALRRQSQGIVQILFDSEFDLSVSDIIEAAEKSSGNANEEAKKNIKSFFKQRVEHALGSSGAGGDVVNSVIDGCLDMPLNLLKKKVIALIDLKRTANYSDFILSIKRVHNILPENPPSSVNGDLFSTDAESDLFNRISEIESKASLSLNEHDFDSALKTIVSLTPSINRFFDEVLVMDKDDKIRQNRLALLCRLSQLSSKICDLSKLSEK
ncbi:MAG: glycine--tRNA ligase subunit beta [Nitrospirota bacterium]|nr:MAG: glycine--tRNA ligase subunit beta [Nitrospirota bacterium]